MRKKGTIILLLVGLCLSAKAQIPITGQFHFDMDELRSHLSKAPSLTTASSFSSQETSVQILLPTPKGNQITFSVWEDPILSADLQDKHTDYHTYALQATEDEAFFGRLLLSPAGLDAVIIGGEQVLFVEAMAPDEALHRVYFWQLGNNFLSFNLSAASLSSPESTGSFRLAVLADDDYARFHQQDVVRAILASVNGVNAFLQFEQGIKVDLHYFETVSYRELLTCRQEGFRGRTGEAIRLFGDRAANGTLAVEDYDIGHLFSGRGFGGTALANVAGSNTSYDWNEDGLMDGPAKAAGGSGAARPVGANWWGHLCKGISRQIGNAAPALVVQQSTSYQTIGSDRQLTAGLGNLEHFPVTMKHYSGPGTRGECQFPHLSCLPLSASAAEANEQTNALLSKALQHELGTSFLWPWLMGMQQDTSTVSWWLQGVRM